MLWRQTVGTYLLTIHTGFAIDIIDSLCYRFTDNSLSILQRIFKYLGSGKYAIEPDWLGMDSITSINE